MRAYLITTGTLFGLITAAHGYEAVDRGQLYGSDVMIVALSAGLAIWAWRLGRTRLAGVSS
jgi:hypothetical protein